MACDPQRRRTCAHRNSAPDRRDQRLPRPDAQPGTDEEERPGWLYWLDPARARLQLADAAYACHAWADAAEGFREALPALAGFPRDEMYYRARLEDAQRRA